MTQAPLDRDQQIQFMREASVRREERIARWSQNDMVNEVLCEPAEVPNVTNAYVRSDVHERKCA